jgi:tRNA modification GTPase
MAPITSFLAAPLGEVELRAEDLRRAAQALGRLTGAVDVEDVLDQVFSRFCIGK